jgi:hypothetical protein
MRAKHDVHSVGDGIDGGSNSAKQLYVRHIHSIVSCGELFIA